MLTITRYCTYASSFDKFKIFCDEKNIGKIKQGETIEFDIPQGEHEIYLKVYWCRSQKIKITEHEKDVQLYCATNLKGFRIFFAVMYITLLCNKYIRLERTSFI